MNGINRVRGWGRSENLLVHKLIQGFSEGTGFAS